MRLIFLSYLLPCVLVAQQNSVEPTSNTNAPQSATVIQSEAVSVESKEADQVAKKVSNDSQVIASRFLQNFSRSTHHTDSRSPSMEERLQLEQDAGYFVKNQPNSFEANFFAWLAGRYEMRNFKALEKAAALKPMDVQVLNQLSAAHFIQGDQTALKKDLANLAKLHSITDAQILYGSDLLNSVPEKGILVVHGFSDFQAVAYNQMNKNIRTDVTLVSLDFLQSSDYRDRLETALELPTGSTINVDYFVNMVKMNGALPVIYSVTIPSEYFSSLKSNLYVHGLGFSYSRSATNPGTENVELLAKFNLWNVDHCTSGEAFLPQNYLPFLLSVESYMKSEGATVPDELKATISNLKKLI